MNKRFADRLLLERINLTTSAEILHCASVKCGLSAIGGASSLSLIRNCQKRSQIIYPTIFIKTQPILMEKLVMYISISIIVNEYEFGLPSEQFFPLTVTIPVVSSLRQVFI